MATETILTGKVEKKLIATGSKSERTAVVLVTDTKEYVLRQYGGNAMGDSDLDDLVGKTIKGEGKINGYTFVMSDWDEA